MVKFPEPLDGPRDTGPRYAVYFAPAGETDLHRAGNTWLGRDCIIGEDLAQPAVDGVSPQRLAELTADPRRYGFHATLKPPFRIKPGRTLDEFLAAAETLAGGTEAFEVDLALRQFSGFFALMQAQSRAEMRALAAAAVSELDGFRALPGEKELARRRTAGLSSAQETLLQRWGYPYVMGEFRFHMTLTQRITDDAEAERLKAALAPFFDDVLAHSHWIDALVVFRQETPDAPFLQTERFALAKPA